MDILAGLIGLLIGAFAAWLMTRSCATADMSRLRARLEERVTFWQGETERARASAAQVAERTAAWVAGCEQGRQDVLSLARTCGAISDVGALDPTGPGGTLADRFVPRMRDGEAAGPRATVRSG
jgi:hypothetical protein